MTQLVWILVAAVVLIVVAGAIVLARRPRLHGLPEASRVRYAETWRAIETRFIDHPREAVKDADALAMAILRERGARVDDGQKMPRSIEEARAAARPDSGEGEGEGDRERGGDGQGTEGLRRAMVTYQGIVDDAVGESTRRQAESGRREVAG